MQAREQEKKLGDKTGLFIDRVYHLYAIVRRANEEVQIVVFNCPDLYHTSSDSGERQYKLGI